MDVIAVYIFIMLFLPIVQLYEAILHNLYLLRYLH
jgi:hypothetical protein